MQVSSVLQQYLVDDLLLVAIDIRHHDSHLKTLSLKKGCFEINVEKISTFAGCHLATHPKSWSCGSSEIGLLVILLRVLETPQYLPI